MIRLTQSLAEFLWRFHRDILSPLLFGHVELYTEEIEQEYYAWLQTEEGKQYLVGGGKYKEGWRE
jgi:hypothetical protein